MPAAHASHVVAESAADAAYVPAAQTSQSVVPNAARVFGTWSRLVRLPSGQAMQSVCPAVSWYSPRTQSEHAAVSALTLNCPGAQSVQAVAPRCEVEDMAS